MGVRLKIKRCYDPAVIRGLHKRIFPTDDFPDETTVDWVVLDGDTAVGFCMMAEESKEIGYMVRAGIFSTYWGAGLHKRMIRTREMFARKIGMNIMITYTKIDNIQSSANLQKAGYQLYIPEKRYADFDCLYWRKKLV